MRELTARFPDILFEGCSAGGNRFDLGILSYFPQIWASDDTDALCRAEIQTGYSYGYPMSVVSAHVSACPNHQTLRVTPLETRFAVAAFGICGYECNFCDLSREDFAAVRHRSHCTNSGGRYCRRDGFTADAHSERGHMKVYSPRAWETRWSGPVCRKTRPVRSVC